MAKEFGSKADMISTRIDEVSRNSIWREHCTKELSMTKLNTNFSISNPWKMPTLPEKPNYVLPNTNVNDFEMYKAADELRELCSIKDADKLPPEKYDQPETSGKEYGWSSRTLGESNGMFEYRRSGCELTKYADAYYMMSNASPFSSKNS